LKRLIKINPKKTLKEHIIFYVFTISLLMTALIYVSVIYINKQFIKISNQKQLEKTIVKFNHNKNQKEDFKYMLQKNQYIYKAILQNTKNTIYKNEEISNNLFQIETVTIKNIGKVLIYFNDTKYQYIMNLYYKDFGLILLFFMFFIFIMLFILKELMEPLNQIQAFLKNNNSNNDILNIGTKNRVTKELLNIQNHFNDLLLNLNKMLQKNVNIANTDELTGLGNRYAMKKSIEKKILKKDEFNLVLIDLDGFKEVNDTFGHDTGDKVLIQSATIFKEFFEERDIYRLGGDEFLIIVDKEQMSLIKLCDNLEKLNETFYSHEELNAICQLNVSCSIGVSEKNNIKEKSLSILLKEADIALYESKKGGKNKFTIFNSDMQETINNEVELKMEIENAIKNEEFEMYIQPQYNCKLDKVVSGETLIRWNHPQKGLLSPDYFINFIEDKSYIILIGMKIIEDSFKMFKEIKKRNKDFKSISINISGTQLLEKSFFNNVFKLYKKYNIKHGEIEFEIIERILMKSKSLSVIEQLKSIGIKFSIDDFGTGYSSLSILQNLPIHKLKIDKSFVDNMYKTKIINFIVDLSKNLNLELIAEGVETKKQMLYIEKLGCELFQGYYIDKPMQLNNFLKKYGSSPKLGLN